MSEFLRGFLDGRISVIDKGSLLNDVDMTATDGGKEAKPHAVPGSGEWVPSTQEQGRTGNLPVTLSDEAKAVHDAALVADLRAKQKALAARIAEKVYEHGFLL